MMASRIRFRQAGVSMIEVLVSLVIILVGLVGLAGLSTRAQQAEMESYQRVQAVIVLQDMLDRINANRAVASCYTTGTGHWGTGSALTASCSAGTLEQQARAIADMTAWSDLLKGTSEKQGTTNLGVMIDARGCLSYDAGSAGPPVVPASVTVTVAWQGLAATAPPPVSVGCGLNLYSNESMRRAVSAGLSFATL